MKRSAADPHPRGSVALVAAARWETQYAPEWLAYHRAIGFDHVYLICNDAQQDALWEAVLPFAGGPRPFLTFIHYPWQGQRFHILLHGLRRARQTHPWLMMLDIDEFLHLPGCHDIERWLDTAAPDWDVIHFNRTSFGHGGFLERPPGGVLRTYTRRQTDLTSVTRFVARSARLLPDRAESRSPIWTEPDSLLAPSARQVNVLGEEMPAPPRPAIASDTATRLRARGFVHHYPFKSEQDFLLRCARGTQGEFAGQTLWRELHASGQYRAVLNELNAEEDVSLARFWGGRIAGAAARATILPRPSVPNIALQKPATQSSASEWSRSADPAQDAVGLVNGTISGSFQNHTKHESRPWWKVDLRGSARVHEIRIFNRCDWPALADRAAACQIAVSEDGTHWITLFHQTCGPAFGGADGNPLIVRPPSPVLARFVRVTLLSTTNLHLDQVEVYGEAP